MPAEQPSSDVEHPVSSSLSAVNHFTAMIDAIGSSDDNVPSAAIEEQLPPSGMSQAAAPDPHPYAAEPDAPDLCAEPPFDADPAVDAAPPAESVDGLPLDRVAFWKSFLEVLEKSDSFATMHLLHGRPSFEDGGYVLRFPGDFSFQYSQVSKRSSLDKLMVDFAAFAGRPVPIKAVLDASLTVVAETGPADNAPIVADRVKRAILADDMEQEPVIRTIIAVFDGEVL